MERYAFRAVDKGRGDGRLHYLPGGEYPGVTVR